MFLIITLRVKKLFFQINNKNMGNNKSKNKTSLKLSQSMLVWVKIVRVIILNLVSMFSNNKIKIILMTAYKILPTTTATIKLIKISKILIHNFNLLLITSIKIKINNRRIIIILQMKRRKKIIRAQQIW